MTKEGDLVIDPFMGSGTTGIAARHLGRNFLGIELDENYVRLANSRTQSGDVAEKGTIFASRGEQPRYPA
jgi:DNA modification methylase